MATSEASRPPGRPRSAEADAAIVSAALEILVNDGYRGLSMEGVRALAGVGKATLYRRFASKAELAKAAMRQFRQGLAVPEDTGSVADDLRAYQHAVARALEAVGAPLFIPRILIDAAEDPELHRLCREALIDPRRSVITTILERGVDRGELRADLDLDILVDLLTGPYLYRLLVDAGDIDGAYARNDAYLDVILHGARRD
jgi:AcrR family transcriptional regulator